MNKEQYELIATKLLEKGYTTDTTFEALKANGFSVRIDGVVYSNIYASRVIAIMHSRNTTVQPLEL